MRITFILPDVNLSGGIRVAAVYARKLKSKGHEVSVISTPARKPSFLQRIKALRSRKNRIGRCKTTSSHFDGVNVAHTVLDRRIVMDSDVPDGDVVIATWWETAEWVAGLSKSKGAKVYFLQGHEVYDHINAARVAATWSLPMHKIVVSKWLLDLARNTCGDHDASLVPNGVDMEQFNAPHRGKQPVPTVGTIYSGQEIKGCGDVLAAFREAASHEPRLRLVSFGTEAPSAGLPLPRKSEYVCRPFQTELRKIYARCDAWLWGSRSEGFGLPILEAMACRTPVIATSAGAAPDLLAHGGGLLLEPKRPAEMAQAILKVIRLSNEDWRAMSQAACQNAINHSWDDAVQRFESALHKAVAGRKSADL